MCVCVRVCVCVCWESQARSGCEETGSKALVRMHYPRTCPLRLLHMVTNLIGSTPGASAIATALAAVTAARRSFASEAGMRGAVAPHSWDSISCVCGCVWVCLCVCVCVCVCLCVCDV